MTIWRGFFFFLVLSLISYLERRPSARQMATARAKQTSQPPPTCQNVFSSGKKMMSYMWQKNGSIDKRQIQSTSMVIVSPRLAWKRRGDLTTAMPCWAIDFMKSGFLVVGHKSWGSIFDLRKRFVISMHIYPYIQQYLFLAFSRLFHAIH